MKHTLVEVFKDGLWTKIIIPNSFHEAQNFIANRSSNDSDLERKDKTPRLYKPLFSFKTSSQFYFLGKPRYEVLPEFEEFTLRLWYGQMIRDIKQMLVLYHEREEVFTNQN